MAKYGTRDCGLTVLALTIFVGAFLLFEVQPVMARFILPWFGGGPGIRTTCILFFQVLLLAGYAYAHFTSHWLTPRTQAISHLLLLSASLALLPITPGDYWKPSGTGNPTVQILLVLAASVGLPYFVLSATSPMLQHWTTALRASSAPYRLYALSNLGSLLALVTYPFYVESHFSRGTQATLWGWGLVIYLGCCGYSAVRFCMNSSWKSTRAKAEHSTQIVEVPELVGVSSSSRAAQWLADAVADDNSPTTANPGWTAQIDSDSVKPRNSATLEQHVLWLLLPACTSVLLLATTNKMCQDVASIPFLWVLPLALYLLSFAICFDHPRWYARFPFALALLAGLYSMCWALFEGTNASLTKQIVVYSGGLFVCGMVCHGELFRLRPDVSLLTRYYLFVAAGGALGAVFVGVVAPLIFKDYYELHWGMLLCLGLFTFVCARVRENNRRQWLGLACILPLAGFVALDSALANVAERATKVAQGYLLALRILIWVFLGLVVLSWVIRRKYRNFPYWQALTVVWLFLAVIALGTTLHIHARRNSSDLLHASRNFFGVLKVYEHRKTEPRGHHFLLQHGRITHGLQFVEPQLSRLATTYYNPDSGVGLAWSALPPGPHRIGLVGLGTGTLTTYAQTNDVVRIYEINPDVWRIAGAKFTYLSNCAGNIQAVMGDARLALERDPPQQFDLLALDAFSSDAIPVHLLTREAFEVYERHLRTNGVIAVHISNHYLNLEPIVLKLAQHFGYKLAVVDYEESDEEWWAYSSTWVLLTRNRAILNHPTLRDVASQTHTNTHGVHLWTDDFASLFQVFK